MATPLVDHNRMSHLDYFRIARFENPQKLYDNWVKNLRIRSHFLEMLTISLMIVMPTLNT